MIHEVKVYNPSGKLQKVISKKALFKRSDRLFQDPFLFYKSTKGRPKGKPKEMFTDLYIPNL
jgi:hypothetical protein